MEQLTKEDFSQKKEYHKYGNISDSNYCFFYIFVSVCSRKCCVCAVINIVRMIKAGLRRDKKAALKSAVLFVAHMGVAAFFGNILYGISQQ